MLLLCLALQACVYTFSHSQLTSALPDGYKEAQKDQDLTAYQPCAWDAGSSSYFGSNFCLRCLRLGLTNPIACIIKELGQSKPDGFLANVGTEDLGNERIISMVPYYTGVGPKIQVTKADIRFIMYDIDFVFEVNIDSCRRVDWTEPLGPLILPKRQVRSTTMKNIVNELFLLPTREAIELTLANAQQSEQEASAYVNAVSPFLASQGSTLYQELQTDFKNASIKMIDDVLCKGVGGVSAWLAVQAIGPRVLGADLTGEKEDLLIGAIAALCAYSMTAVIDWLRAVLEKEILVADRYQWVLWIVLSIISKIRSFIKSLPPLPRVLDRDAVRRIIVRLTQANEAVGSPQLGLTNVQIASSEGPNAC